MSGRTESARHALGAGALLGLLGDYLLRTDGAPALNFVIGCLALAAAVIVIDRRTRRALTAESYTWLGVGVLCALALVWRDAEPLKLLGILCAAVAFSLPALRGGAAWLRRGRVSEYAVAGISTGMHAVFGSALALQSADMPALMDGRESRGGWRHASAALRGALIATPLLIVFAGLFSAADAVFASVLADVVHVDVASVTGHLLLAGFLAWITCGYLYGFATAGGAALLERRPRCISLGITDTAVALALLNLLFLAFVVVQFRYLFGGGALIEVTPGLTYAEYARRGFFELVFTVLLVVPVLLAADAMLRRARSADDAIFRALAGVQVVLVLAIALSAFERLRLYRAAYGLTAQRLYATAVLCFVVVVLLWFAATVLRGRRRGFAFGALVAGLATVGTLYIVNPDVLIVRTNSARAVVGGDERGHALDVIYATSLSADAVPELIRVLPALPPDARCQAARRLLRRWPPDAAPPLRAWNWSVARAHATVRDHAAALRAYAGPAAACGTDDPTR
jgi:hypothetical protein